MYIIVTVWVPNVVSWFNERIQTGGYADQVFERNVMV